MSTDIEIARGADDPPVTIGLTNVEPAGADWRLTIVTRGGTRIDVSTLDGDGALTAEAWEGYAPGVLITWRYTLTQSRLIPLGRLSKWELEMISAGGLQRVVGAGTITGTGGLNSDA